MMAFVETPPLDPDAIVGGLGLSAWELFETYALGRRERDRERLAGRVERLAGAGDPAPDGLRPGDLLVRGVLGHGLATASALVSGELLDLRALHRAALNAEGTLPGRYAWVVEGGLTGHAQEERFARRVADRRGFLPRDQVLLRVAGGAAAPEWAPEAVNRRSPAYIRWYQAELNQIDGAGLVVDGILGPLTRAAVRRYQARKGLLVDGIVGPITERSLMLDGASSPPGYSGPPVGPPPVIPPVPPIIPPVLPVPPVPPVPTVPPIAPGSALGSLESRYFPPLGTPDAAPFSRRATIEPIVDGEDHFSALRARIGSLAAGDAWYVTGWWFNPNFQFATGEKIGDLLLDRAAAGVDVRVILWSNRQIINFAGVVASFPRLTFFLRLTRDNIQAAENLRARTASGGGTPLAGRVLLDWSGRAFTSHHMKLNVFVQSGVTTAFVSGIDYQQDRFAAIRHTLPGQFWHDAGAAVTGEAGTRVLDTFVTRWTEAATLSADTYDIGAGAKPFNPPPLVPLSPPALSSPPSPSADTSIQIVRSVPAVKEFGLLRNTPWATLPRTGVHETLLTFRTMLGAARRYIYIEDQAFNAVTFLFPSIVAACRRGVKVIVLLPGQGDPQESPGQIPPVLTPEVQTGILANLAPVEQMNLAVWQLSAIFVHSKLILIDDELMSVGSANFMDRSMEDTAQGDDSECTAVAVSTGNLVPDLRVKLWAEHLRVPTTGSTGAEIRDLSKSLGFWRPAWGTGLTFPHPDSRLVFVGPASAGSPTPGAPPPGAGGGGGGGGSSPGTGGNRRRQRRP